MYLIYTRVENSSVIGMNTHLFVIIACTSASVARVGDMVLMGKREEKKPLERPRLRWEDNTKVHVQEVRRCAETGLMWLRMGTGGRLL